MRIGYPHPDRLISYPDPHNLSIWRQPIRMRSRRRHRWTILEGNALGRAWLRCPWAAAGPGWASRRRITTQHRRRRRCGGRRRVRRARAGFEIDHSEPLGSRVAISRAAGPDGARNTIGAASNKLNREFRLRRRCGGRRGACRAWPGFETTRRAKLAARTASGRAGPAAAGDQARLQAPLEIRTPRSTPGSGRPGGHRGGQAH